MEVFPVAQRQVELIEDGVMRHVMGRGAVSEDIWDKIAIPCVRNTQIIAKAKSVRSLFWSLSDIDEEMGLCDSQLWYVYQFSRAESSADFLQAIRDNEEENPHISVIELDVAVQDDATVCVRPANEVPPRDIGTTWRAPSGRLYVTEPFVNHCVDGRKWRMEGIPAAWELVQFVSDAAAAEEMSNADDINWHNVSSEWFSYTDTFTKRHAAVRLDSVIAVRETKDGGTLYGLADFAANLDGADFSALRQLLSLAWSERNA